VPYIDLIDGSYTSTRSSVAALNTTVDLTRHSSNENAQAGGKKTIMPQDVIAALKDSEFEKFIPRLEAELKSSFSCPLLRIVLSVLDQTDVGESNR
jgi:hypothetical protein